MFIFLAFLSSFIWIIQGRVIIDVVGKGVGSKRFEQLKEAHSLSGRPAFYSSEAGLYLFHTTGEQNHHVFGRWAIADRLWLNESAIQFVDSWAVTPCEIASLNDNAAKPGRIGWMTTNENEQWVVDDSFSMQCYSEVDNVIYFDTQRNIFLTGYYVKMLTDFSENVYVKVKRTDDETTNFLFKFDTKWLIGSDPTIDNAIAFCFSDAENAIEIDTNEWQFLGEDDSWIADYADIIARNEDSDIVDELREYRSFHDFPDSQRELEGLYYMRNGLAVPRIGLGTGGIWPENTVSTSVTALKLGYRLLDLAREYENEIPIRHIFWEMDDPKIPTSAEVFLLSKVWPTELGFRATSDAIYQSRVNLGVTSISNYMLHWPACYDSIEWMHCQDRVDPDGDWIDSYTALEKAYAEGDIMSIGISNFDIDLLNELYGTVNILPHILQNFASVFHPDMPARIWCKNNAVAYMSYANVRNLHEAPELVVGMLNALAHKYNKSPQAVVYRFMIQTGALIIPRSNSEQHLLENLGVLEWTLSDEDLMSLGWHGFVE